MPRKGRKSRKDVRNPKDLIRRTLWFASVSEGKDTGGDYVFVCEPSGYN